MEGKVCEVPEEGISVKLQKIKLVNRTIEETEEAQEAIFFPARIEQDNGRVCTSCARD